MRELLRVVWCGLRGHEYYALDARTYCRRCPYNRRGRKAR